MVDSSITRTERGTAAAAALLALVVAAVALFAEATAARVPALLAVMTLGATLLAGLLSRNQHVRRLAVSVGLLIPAWGVIRGVGLAWTDAEVRPAGMWLPGTIAALALVQAGVLLRPHHRGVIAFAALLAIALPGLALSEAAGLPPIPGDSVALSVALALAAQSVAIAVASGLPVRFVAFITGHEPGAPLVRGSRERWRIAVTLLSVLVAGTGATFGYLKLHVTQEERNMDRELSAVVQLTAARLELWRKERLGDAQVVAQLPVVKVKLAEPGVDNWAQQGWSDVTRAVAGTYGYSAVALLDAQLRDVGGWPAERSGLAPPPELATSERAILVDWIRDTDRAPMLDVWAPIRDEAGRLRGALVLRSDLRQQLPQFLTRWPLPSLPGDLVLVRAWPDGVETVLQEGGGPRRLLAAASPAFEALVARRGDVAFTRGRDQAGSEVVGVARRINGSRWVVGAKVGQHVAFAAARSESLTLAGVGSVLIFSLVVGVRQTLRSRVTEARARRDAAEREKHLALERLGVVLRELNDVVLVLDAELHIEEANARVEALYGWTAGELVGTRLTDLRAEADRARGAAAEAAIVREGAVYEAVHRRKDGSLFPVEVSARRVEIDGRRKVVAVVRDIAVRKAHESEIERLSRLYRLLSRINHLISHRTAPETLLPGVSAALVELGEFAVAWIALRTADGRLATRALHGPAEGLLAGIHEAPVAAADLPGVLRGAVTEGRMVACSDFQTDPAGVEWRDRAERAGVRSSLALPLRRDGKPVGLIAVLHAEAGHFGLDEIGLLTEAASDVSFALEVAALEQQREHTTAALQASETRLHFVLTASPAVIYSLNARANFTTTFISANVQQVLGRAPEEFLARRETWLENVHPDDLAGALAVTHELNARGSILREYRFRHRDGSWRWMRDEGRLVRGEDGEPLEMVGYWLDITEQRQADEIRRTAEAHYRTLFDTTGLGVVLQDAAGRFKEVNATAASLLGLESSEAARGLLWTDARWRVMREDGRILPAEQHPAAIARQTGERVSNTVLGVARGEEAVRWLLVDAVPERDGGAATAGGVFTIITDISERLRGDLERRKLSRAVEQNPASILITDLDGRIEYVNPRFTEVTGYTLDEVRGKSPQLFKSGVVPDKVYAELWATITAGRVWRGEIVNRKKSGELHTELVVVTPVFDGAGHATHYVALREDITARKRFEENLRILSRAIEQAPLSVVITDASGVIEYVNPEFMAVTGYSLAEVRGRNPRVLKSNRTPLERYREMWGTLTRGGVWRGELINRKKSGEDYIELATISPVTDDSGTVTHYVAIKDDITARKRTESALREAQESYRIIAENTDDVIWLYETGAAAFTFLSPSVLWLVGRTADQLIGRGLDALLPAAAAAELTRLIQRRLVAPEVKGDDSRTAIIELEHLHANGTRIPTEVAITVLHDAAAGGGRILGVTRNITERRRASEALEVSLARLRKAEQIARLGSWERDLLSGRLELSDEARRIFELDATEPDVAAAFAARIHPADRERVLGLMADRELQRPRVALTHRLALAEGRIKHVDLTTEVVLGPDGQPLRMIGTVQDITERRLVELELHELLKMLRALHSVSLAVETASGGGMRELLEKVASHLPAATRVPALARSEIVLGDTRAVAGAAGQPVLELSVPILINGWTAGRVTQTYVAHDGEVPDQWSLHERELIESVARTLGLALGERDSYEQMRRSEERFRAIFDHAAVGMFEVDLTGRITRANPFLGDLVGEAPVELEGRHWTSFVVGLDTHAGLPAEPLELRCRWRREVEFWGLLSARVETDSAGNSLGHICLLQDISALVAARETTLRFTAELEAKVEQRTAELAARNREVQALLHANPDFILRLRADGSLLHVHASRPPDRLSGVAIDLADPRGTQVGAAILDHSLAVGRRAIDSGTTEVIEAALELPAGPCPVELRAAPVGGQDCVVFVRDITDRRRREEEAAAMLAKERELSEMKTRFISVASHEFRTPMAAALGSAELLSNHLDRLPPAKRSELLARIRSSLERVADMLEDVLTLSRMDSRRTEVRIVPVELRAFLESTVEEVRVGDGAKHTIIVEAADELVFPTDATILRHVVSNLLTNAVRYSPPGSTITVRLQRPDDGVTISVADQGIGIPPEDLTRIFEPFERGSNVGTIKGTGLGLNIVRRMTQLLGAAIDVESVQGRGTVFTLKLSPPP